MAIAIITADWHIRYTVPSCLDMSHEEWMQFQRDSLKRIKEIAKENRAEYILVGGDIYHTEQSTDMECITMVQDFATECSEEGISIYIFAGNHDLPYHSSSNLKRSAIGVLFNSSNIYDMSNCPVCKGCNFDIEDYDNEDIIFKHILTIPKEMIPPHVTCDTPETLLERYPDARIIFTGDYHKNFMLGFNSEHGERWVVNSGCLTRQVSDFEDYDPGVYVFDLENPKHHMFAKIGLKQKFSHNGEVKKNVDKSLEDFANGIKREAVTLDFISSVRNELPKYEQSVQDKVNGWIDSIGQ